MKWAVVVFPGSNCDEDAVAAIERVGDEANKVWHQSSDLSQYDAILLPGGFSYGDYLRCGAMARFSPVMGEVKRVAEAGKPIIGICNGFQILTEAGLLPGALLRNNHLQYRCEIVPLVVRNDSSLFTSMYTVGQTIQIPIAHGEGRFHADDETLSMLEKTGRIAFTYANNPNGSVRDIAGILNEQGNVIGMMPHPERAMVSWMGSDDGAALFLSVRNYLQNQSAREAIQLG